MSKRCHQVDPARPERRTICGLPLRAEFFDPALPPCRICARPMGNARWYARFERDFVLADEYGKMKQ